MENVYLGRQPIIDDNSQLSAYEILYRDANIKSNQGDDRYASSVVINSILNKFGTRSLLGQRKAFIKVDSKFLLNDIIFTIPKEFFVFSIFQSTLLNEVLIERIKHLHAKGYVLAINDAVLTRDNVENFRPIFNQLSYVKVSFHDEIVDDLKEIITEIKSNDIKVVAAKVETNELFSLAQSHDCDWFQGYYFAEPIILEKTKDEASHLDIFRLYNLLIQDANIDEITSEFEKNPEVTVQLLQFINSGAFHFKRKISSIHHILTLVGRIPLSQWLMLMIYSKSVSHSQKHSPLMLTVRTRTNLMQNILKEVQPNVKSNMLGEAYFVGLLSLIDVVLNSELRDVLKNINISQEVEDALLREEGILGEIFVLIKDLEAFNTEVIEAFEKKYNLDDSVLKKVIFDSIEDVEEFENAK